MSIKNCTRVGQLSAMIVFCLFIASCGNGPSATAQPASPEAEVRIEPIIKPSDQPALEPTSDREKSSSDGPTRAADSQVAATESPETTPDLVSTAALESAIPTIENRRPGYNPLTGEYVADPSALQRRPIAVKISNISRVRPQAGLSKADIVFEHLTEGGITRFTAIYYTNDAQKAGSIRSGRLIDLEIPLMFDAAFAYSGSSIQIKMMIEDSSFFDRVVSPDFGHGGYYRDYSVSSGGRFLEDTMFTDTRVIRTTLQERGQDHPPELHALPQFQEELPAGGKAVKSVEIQYLGTSAYWFFDAGVGRFLRWSDGIRHIDASTKEQLSFDNVIIVQAVHLNTEIIEDSGGSPSIQVQLWGSGPVSIFRDGFQYDGIWRRERPGDMLTFYSESGSPLYLSPGTSFYQIVPLGYQRIYVELE